MEFDDHQEGGHVKFTSVRCDVAADGGNVLLTIEAPFPCGSSCGRVTVIVKFNETEVASLIGLLKTARKNVW